MKSVSWLLAVALVAGLVALVPPNRAEASHISTAASTFTYNETEILSGVDVQLTVEWRFTPGHVQPGDTFNATVTTTEVLTYKDSGCGDGTDPRPVVYDLAGNTVYFSPDRDDDPTPWWLSPDRVAFKWIEGTNTQQTEWIETPCEGTYDRVSVKTNVRVGTIRVPEVGSHCLWRMHEPFPFDESIVGSGDFALLEIGSAGECAPAPSEPRATFTWSVPETLSYDLTTGFLRYEASEASKAYLLPDRLVDFDACLSDPIGNIAWYHWTFTIPASHTTTGEEETVQIDDPDCKLQFPQGKLPDYHPMVASLAVEDGSGNVSEPYVRPIEPRNYFIVSIGDSYASGEGNPHDLAACSVDPDWTSIIRPTKGLRGGVWGGLAKFLKNCHGDGRWNGSDKYAYDCHRSSQAGPAVASRAIEARDPHTSVTFLHLACSGAEVLDGLLGSYDGADAGDDGTVPAQIDQLSPLLALARRQPDALLVSIGGNDIGFAKIVETCLFHDCTPTNDSGAIKTVFREFQRGIDELTKDGGALDKLYQCLTTYFCESEDGIGLGLDPSTIFVTEYPGLGSASSDGTLYCDYLGFDSVEFQIMDQDIGQPLNDHLRDWWTAKSESSVTFISGISQLFKGHGICLTEGTRWFRQIRESIEMQSIDGTAPKGAFHPNDLGHEYGYAPPIEQALRAAGIGSLGE